MELTNARETDRTKRVKEARDEAKKEIDAYKANKEEEYKKFEAEVRTPSLDHDPEATYCTACIIKILTKATTSTRKETRRPRRTQIRRPRRRSRKSSLRARRPRTR